MIKETEFSIQTHTHLHRTILFVESTSVRFEFDLGVDQRTPIRICAEKIRASFILVVL
jgi:hypothetical protein